MSQIITFYSYKGGVGRTMALANVSVLLAKWGHKILVVDWDLEAPGLEHFYKDYIDTKITETLPGVIDFLQLNEIINWQDAIIEVKIQESQPIHLISSGRRDESYFNKIREFNVVDFYKQDGGDVIENLRDEWLANYDYILIDSRTGITEIGGICTIQLPDTVVMLFTATNQGFDGVLDIIKRAAIAQQKLQYDRQKLVFLPIPSKFDNISEFKLSQDWLVKFANDLEPTYNDWLPTTIDRKDFLELTKIPYKSYFSFGEKLPVIEQGVNDPAGLGYAYENLAVLIANNLSNVDLLVENRELYISKVDKHYTKDIEKKKNGNDTGRKLKQLKQKLNINENSVQIIKNKDAIVECIQKSILPLLEAISATTNEFSSLFKSRNEEFFIFGERDAFLNSDNYERFVVQYNVNHKNIVDIILKEYNEKKNYILNSIIYTCNFNSLRKSQNYLKIPFTLKIQFYELIFEAVFAENIIFDKLYDEIITKEEIETITQQINTKVLEQIEAVTRKDSIDNKNQLEL